MICMEQTERIDDKTGRKIIRFTPVLHGDCCSTGMLLFACWEVWEDASLQEITAAARKAMANAREVLRNYAAD